MKLNLQCAARPEDEGHCGDEAQRSAQPGRRLQLHLHQQPELPVGPARCRGLLQRRGGDPDGTGTQTADSTLLT